ncbi:FG-GAP-like repeat-containing protein [Arthrobacter sp. StoSoilB5]|uniref:FG-GAP-like repeat-containing protein n=1 Tax=Arthrobacter sp. StoSoilB5 TaxID=2830992 RepID=UPI001CC70A1C|nr:FG-GAP-like repeat-containing protein [Arthrobacter sp. StoSoilB5]
MAVDSSTHALYVTHIGLDTVSVIHGSATTKTLDVPQPGTPVVDPATHAVYVPSRSGSVSVIRDPSNRDFTADGRADVLARDTHGALWLYPTSGTGGWLAPERVGQGWNSMTSIVAAGDFNTGGRADVLARDGDGALWLYAGNGSGGWLPRVQVGQGWQSMTALVGPGDFDGDGFPDVLARDPAGVLWLYPGNGIGGWFGRLQVGQGWNVMTTILGCGDFTADTEPDVLARDAAGLLWIYPGDGSGGWKPRVQAGQGWNAMNTIVAPGDFNGDGRADLLARDSAGILGCILAPTETVGWHVSRSGRAGWKEIDLAGPGWIESADVDSGRETEEGVKRWYDRAVATGEERVLAWTADGDLHSYRRDEITLGGKYVPVVEPWCP